MKKTAVLVFNPGSGKDQISKEELIDQIQLHLEGFDLAIFEILGESIIERLTEMFNQVKPDLVLIAGGDGTIKLTTDCLKSQVTLAILPLGSANGLAKCLAINTLKEGLQALQKMKIFKMDAVQIDDELCLHLADFGFNASMIHKFEQSDSRGMLGYIKSSIREVFTTKSSRFRIETDVESIELEAKMLVIANGEKYGTGAVINTEGVIDDGKFEVIAVDYSSAGDLISITKGLVTGEHQDHSAVKTWSLESCRIFNLDMANFQIDGELRGNPETINVKIKKGAFDFVINS